MDLTNLMVGVLFIGTPTAHRRRRSKIIPTLDKGEDLTTQLGKFVRTFGAYRGVEEIFSFDRINHMVATRKGDRSSSMRSTIAESSMM